MKYNSSDNSTENVMKTEHDNSAANTSTESIDPRGIQSHSDSQWKMN